MWQVNREAIIGDLQALVRIDSQNPGLVPGAIGELHAAEWLAETCSELGFEVALQETAPGRPNVLACWKGTGGKSILLTGHTDIVSIENMHGDPLDARIEDGKLYGRGSYDMKGGLASILGAVRALRDGGFQPKGDIWLGFVTDEEYLSIGTDAMVQRIKPDAAILTEPTNGDLCIAHKGFAWLTLTTYGKATHGSLYDEGVDAVAHMGRVLGALEAMERATSREHPLVGRASVHASIINGGLGWSTYPDTCTLKVEHRMLPDEKPENIVARWRAVLDGFAHNDPKFSGNVSLDFSRPGYEITQDAPIVKTLDAAYQQVVGGAPRYMGMYAWLDSAIMGAAGIPTVIYGPQGAGAHAAVEYVEIDSVIRCAEVIAQATADWTGLS